MAKQITGTDLDSGIISGMPAKIRYENTAKWAQEGQIQPAKRMLIDKKKHTQSTKIMHL